MGPLVEQRVPSAPERERRRPPQPARPSASPQQRVLALQRGLGNHATARMLARKVEDIVVAGDLPKPVAEAVRRYNATAAIGSIDQPEEKEKRRKGDAFLLNAILDQLYEKETLSASEQTLLDTVNRHNQTLRDENRKGIVSGAAPLPPDGPIVFTNGFPKDLLQNTPVVDAAMFSVEHIDITINGRPYRLLAGQDYLNAGTSRAYQTGTAPIKGGSIAIHARPAQNGGEEAMVGDAHHRFVWGSYFGHPISATFRPGWGTRSDPWSTLRYKRDPRNEYGFEENSLAVDEVFLAAVSPLPEFAGRFGSANQAEREFLLQNLRIALSNGGLKAEDGELDKLASLLRGKVAKSKASPFEVMVKHLEQTSKDKAHAKAMARLMLESFPAGTLPVVALNRAAAKGFYSSRTHVIVLDPDKHDGPDDLLDTLAFESGKALRREDFLAVAMLATEIESEVTDRYLGMLLEATASGGVNSLVLALEIPEQYFTLADAAESLKAKKLVSADKTSLMPAPSALPERHKRTALAAFMQQEWSAGDQQKYFAIWRHSVGNEMEPVAVPQQAEPAAPLAGPAVSAGGGKLPSPGPATDADFTDVHLATGENEKYGGALNKLDELTYTFGVDKGEKVLSGTDPFVGIFKPDKDKTPHLDTEEARRKRAEEFQQSKAPASGIQADDQRITERNLAVQAINNLLAADVIPATFKAKHAHDDNVLEGIVMEKVKGKEGKPEGLRELAQTLNMKWFDIEKDPIVRKGLSNLYLLDTICGQVDRHKGNYLIEAANGKIVGVKAIDNDLAFGTKYTDYQYSAAGVDPKSVAWHSQVSAGKRADELTEIDRDFARRIVDLAGKDAPLRQAVAAYLTSAEIDATVSRLRSLADFLRPMLEQNSPRITSAWK